MKWSDFKRIVDNVLKDQEIEDIDIGRININKTILKESENIIIGLEGDELDVY